MAWSQEDYRAWVNDLACATRKCVELGHTSEYGADDILPTPEERKCFQKLENLAFGAVIDLIEIYNRSKDQ